jgi:NADP-dependent 3-hydroxy acid dehydrogenase YdfG
MELTNKNIIVTGATSGIGKALTITLLNAGANVAFCGRSADKMANLLAELATTSGKTYSQCFDATNFVQATSFVNNSISELGDIDFLINCAGANSSRGTVGEIDVADLQSMLQVNLVSPFVIMKEVYNQSMLNKQSGMIINVLSTVCNFANEGIGSYTASKAGFDALVKVFRKEARDQGIKICSIYPGGVDTDFRDADRPQYLSANAVVKAILSMMSQDENACLDELVIRPMVEKNYS